MKPEQQFKKYKEAYEARTEAVRALNKEVQKLAELIQVKFKLEPDLLLEGNYKGRWMSIRFKKISISDFSSDCWHAKSFEDLTKPSILAVFHEDKSNGPSEWEYLFHPENWRYIQDLK
jgi:hypothetical protein